MDEIAFKPLLEHYWSLYVRLVDSNMYVIMVLSILLDLSIYLILINLSKIGFGKED